MLTKKDIVYSINTRTSVHFLIKIYECMTLFVFKIDKEILLIK